MKFKNHFSRVTYLLFTDSLVLVKSVNSVNRRFVEVDVFKIMI